MSNPVFREFYSEREVVREERRQRDTHPDGKLMENFLAAAFIAHPYGRPIIGWEDDIKFLKKKRVKHIFQNYYCPNNAVVAVVGDVNPDEVMKTIEKYFGEISPKRIVPVPVSEEPEQSGERRVEVELEANPKLAIGYHKPALPHFDDYVFDVIDILLSDGRTSRLYKKLVEEKKIASDQMTYITGCKDAKAISILVRGGTDHVVDEIERNLNDSLGVVGIAIEDGKILIGGGATPMELTQHLHEYATTVGGREQLAIEAFASAIEIIPRTLAENAGIDPINTLIDLRKAHKAGKKDAGLNVWEGTVTDMKKLNILEPMRVMKQAIQGATETAMMILRIDDVIASKSGGGMGGMPPGGMPPGMGGMGGMD